MPGELAERGIWWQIGGFAVVSAASVVLLVEFDGAQSRAYRYFEAAVRTMYWANVFVLIGLFEGVRRMFEKASELRARYRQQAERKAEERGMKRGIERGMKQGIEAGHKAGPGAAALPQEGGPGKVRRRGQRRQDAARYP